MNNRSYCCQGQLPRVSKGVRMRSAAVVSLFVCMAGLAPACRADAPSWMHALTSAPMPPHDEKDEAVVLYSEEILTVQPNGKIKETDRKVYKILRPGGKEYGQVHFTYDSETKITNVHGWCIPAQGKDFEVKEKEMTEKNYVSSEYITDVRSKVMNIPASEVGNIIGYEVEQEVRPYVLKDEWYFQQRVPVGDARYTLQLPAGWEYKAVWINHSELPPSSIGSNQWQWQVRDIPSVKHEDWMPPWKGVAGMMLLSLIPPGTTNQGFLEWSEMGNWYNGLVQNRREATPEIKQKVAELTANRPLPLAKMRALANFAQNDVRYVAIELGIGGWQPHPATATFSHRYGDCKDKATLLSAMLHEINIDSYYVLINTARGGINEKTPAGLIFNHAILAIRLPDGPVDSSIVATLQHPKLGRLLFFDPTDEMTPFGQLHGPLQSNYGLLVTPQGGELTRLPQLPTEISGVMRTAKLTFDARGTLVGSVHQTLMGDSAWHYRWALRDVTKDVDRIKPIETLMSHSMGSFQITKATVENMKENSSPLGFEWTFVAIDYGKTAGDLLLVRPRVLGVETHGVLETKEPRKYPLEFEGPRKDTDTFEIKLPAGYVVDELPPAADADYSFASYHSKTEAVGDTLRYTRTFELKEVSVPVEKAEELKKFYRIIASDERNTAVLKPVGK